MNNTKSKIAFTLAEVLITLTIIGVIAALTIPNLMQSWRKHERITQIKEAYSILSNAVKMSTTENGSPDVWEWNFNTYTFVNTFILPYLKVKEDCGQYDYYHGRYFTGKGCFEGIETGENNFFYYLNGNKLLAPYSWYTLKLDNGMDFAFKSSPNGRRIYVAVDVNGRQGPTKAGVDVFGFQINMEEKHGSVVTNISNGATFKNYKEVLTKGINQCNLTSDQSGLNCTHLLELNHWEFPDDYPVKKF